MLKSLKYVGLALLVVCAFAQPAVAGREFADIYTDCGLGAMIAPHSDGVAAVTNVTWDLGTTAISSNISSPDSCGGGKEKMAAFVYDSQDLLLQELANGSGGYLDALTALAGIEAAQKELFISTLRSDVGHFVMTSEFTTQSRFEKAEALFNIVTSNSYYSL
ncbi:hypothetical protein BMS3Abin14_01499 [bacterium BMS3Abin14]|nr:hypothetical protein BMS3Abin14_01499 [bacterium BMS3Abin14]